MEHSSTYVSFYKSYSLCITGTLCMFNKGYSFVIWKSFCGVCSQWEGLPLVMSYTKSLPLTTSLTKACSDLEWIAFVFTHTECVCSAILMALVISTVGAEFGQNLKPFFKKNAKLQRNKRQLWDQTYTHKIVHSSAVYYQNWNVICEFGKKLLPIKSVKKNFNT